MADTLKCPKCGEENPRTNKFCDTCGAKLAGAAAPAVKEEPRAPEKIEKKKAEKPAAQKSQKEHARPLSFAPSGEEAASGSGISINWETMAWLAIILVTIILRFSDLGTKPLHHDESMHAFYGYKLFKGEGYTYNPMMHGPFHYHANALVYFLFGVSDYTARVAPAIYGVIGVLLIWFFRPYVGRLGAVFIALILAVSPTFVYQSRFIREDIFMAVDTIALFIGMMRYFDSRKPAWLYLAAVGLAFSWATKEATYITLFIFGTFLIFRYIWEYSYRNVPDRMEKEGFVYPTVQYWLKDGRNIFLYALGLFVLVHGLLYFGKQPGNSIFQNLKYVWDGYVEALLYWLGQHGVERGSQPWFFYILQIPFYEMQSVIFMLIASFVYLIKPGKRTFFNVFVIYWWIMSVAVYSWAGERMPWLAIHPLLPMCVLAGKYAAEVVEEKQWEWRRAIAIAGMVLLTMASIHGTMNVCFYGEGASPLESLVYVQTSTDVTRVANKIKHFADELKDEKWASQEFRGFDPRDMEIVCEDYCTWPFAWYLRDFRKIAYDPKNVPENEMGKPLILSGIEEANQGHDQRVKDMLTSDTKIVNGKTVKKDPKEIYIYTRYKLREWWAPDREKFWRATLGDKMKMLYDRFMYREVWNELGSYDFVVYVRQDLEKYWRSWDGRE
jgi:uncharacterized protein (TIGR03663 family)